ncbi:7121_t:CDS:2, partial [Entrophospora sp. SA101]
MKPMKFITEDTFKVHKGLDLANLMMDEKQPEQIHFWAFGPRQNKTVRPDILISSDYFNLSQVYILQNFLDSGIIITPVTKMSILIPFK